MRGRLRNYWILWLTAIILAPVVEHLLYGNASVRFWMRVYNITPNFLTEAHIPVSTWRAVPLNEVWYYLILSVAGGITLAKVLTIIAQSAIERNRKRASVWLSGLLGSALSAYFISLLAYSVGAWRKIGLEVFYNTRGPFGPTLVFATAIIVAKLLSSAAQSDSVKSRLFLTLGGLSIAGVLTMFTIPVFAPGANAGSYNTFIVLVILDGLMFIALALVTLFAVVKLVVVTVRRSSAHSAASTP